MDSHEDRTRKWIAVGAVALAITTLWLARRERSAPPSPTPAAAAPQASPLMAGADPSNAPGAEVPAASHTALGQNEGSAVPLTVFDDWTRKYLAAGVGEVRTALEAEGELLALERREFLFDLIQTDPEAALAAAVPLRIRRKLPGRIQSLLEDRVSGRGILGVLVADDFELQKRDVRREVILNHQRYEAYVYGPRLAQVTRSRVPLHGIAIGPRLAVHKDAVRRLEMGEAVPAGAAEELCPISSRPANIQGTPVAAEVGGVIENFCGVGHVELLNQRLAADAGGGDGAGDPPVAEDSWSQGPKTCLFMRVAFPDDPTAPITEDGAYALMDGVNQWYTENSYDTTSIIPTVTPLLMLPQPKAWYGAQGTGALLSDARQVARDEGFDTDNFHWDIVRHGSVPGFNYGGLGYVRGKGTWLQSSSVGVAVHELGHNYGLWHANFWSAAGDSVVGPGSNVEYGNSYDTMGAASAGNNQFNAAFKNQLDWLPDPFVRTVTTSGIYRLYTYDVPGLVSGRTYALKIRKDYDRNYWAEFRQKFTANRWFLNGVLLNWDPWNNGVANSAGGTHLLDTTPGTPSADSSREDAAVVIGRTFSDPAAGVHLTPIARGNTSPENWIDVVVNLGFFPTNSPPTLSITADRASVATGMAVNFSATATDPDGDPLAYAWDFGDATFGANSPNVSKSWITNGEYTVRCTVSDLRGGLFSQKAVITVGAPETFRLSGRITTDTGAPLEGVRVHNGLATSAYRGTYTDSDGRYVLANLPAGTNTIAAVKYGYALSRSGWNNPVVVGPNTGGLDWNAAAGAIVTVAAIDGAASEAGLDPAVFRISRTGPTAAALTVKFNRTGTAFLNTDYSMLPAPSGSPLQLVIPAGAPFVNITVAPVSDLSSEGPETVTLTLMEDASYVLGSLAEATITIADDDPAARPTVSVSASGAIGDNLATESGSDSGAFMFTRSGGSVAGELIIHYSVSGSATPGIDYASLAGVVSIPSGETVTAVPFRVIDDADVETNESVIVTVLADPAYNGAGSSAVIVIADDDPATVTITATDNTAREAGGNNGTFTVTRQGSLAANLPVNYTVSGTASNTADFAALPGSVTIPAGRATATITVAPVNDSILEGDETVIVSLASHPGCNVGNPGSAVVTIIDDEIPSVTLAVTNATVNEAGPAVGAWTFARTGSTTGVLTVYFNVSGPAVPGADYAPLGGSIVIPAGTNSAVLPLTPLNDSVREADEKVFLTLRSDPAYNLGTTTPQAITIKDNDTGLPGVGFTFAASSGPESDTLVQLSVGLSTNSASTVTVNYSVTGGSATGGGVDYTLSGGTLTFAAGVLNQSVNISINNDSLVETNESIVITLSNPSDALLDAIPVHRYTILDDDASGTITITASDALASESGPDTGAFLIARSGGTTNAQAVFFQVVGTAGAPSDYASIGNSVVIPAGSNSVTIVIVPVDDNTDETNETVVINLTSAPGARIGSPDLATVTILDNDDSAGLPVVTVTASDAMASEPGPDTATFTISRDRATNSALAVQFSIGGTATSGTDFNSLGTTVTIPAGAYETNLLLTARDDAIFETNETVVLTLTISGTYRVGTPAAATAIIVDNEIGVSIASAGVTTEDGSSSGGFIVTRVGNTVSNLLVNVNLGGTAGSGDFLPLPSPVLIPAGTNIAWVPVIAVDDGEAEGNETVVCTLAPGAGYAITSPGNATVVILDDEPAIAIVASDATAYEGGGDPGAFTLTRSGNTNDALTVFFTVGGTAGNGVDYAPIPSSLVFAAGQISVEIAVLPVDDAVVEGTETIQITLTTNASYAVLAPGSALVTLIDDEINLLPVVTITSPVTETVFLADTNSALVLEATAADDGRPNPPGGLTFAWTRVQGPGVATFGNSNAANTTVRFSAAGTHVLRLEANDGQLSGSDDVTVVVNPDVALATGLEAHWRFDEASGLTAADASGRGRTAALANGAAFGTGRFGHGLDLDGVDDVASFVSMGLTRLTVTAWVRADSQGDSTTPRILQLPGYNIRIRRDPASTTNALALESQRSGTAGEWRSPGNVVADGNWYHIAVAYDSATTTSNPEFYVNGASFPATLRTTPVGTQLSNLGTGYIGNSGALDRSWDGQIDELRIYSRLLSAAEIAQVAAGPPANFAPLVSAGPPQTATLADVVSLAGVVTDDGQPVPPGAVTAQWSRLSGPGVVSFAQAADPETTATFSAGGRYVLRLTAEDGQVKMADDVTITILAPATVSIQAVRSVAAEHSGAGTQDKAGIFAVSRAGDFSSALAVQLSIGGTASNGLDYQALTNVIVIEPNQPSALVFIAPTEDAVAEGEETVEIAIAPSTAYLIGAPASGTVYLADTPWDDWRFRHFTGVELTNANISGDSANPDGDEFRNLLEYAFNFDPKAAEHASGFSGALEPVPAAPGIAGAGQGFVVTFKRRLPPSDLRYELEWSSDFTAWSSLGPNDAREFQRLADGNGITETVKVQVFDPLPTPIRFMRLKVARQ